MLNLYINRFINWIIMIFFSLSICLPKSYSTIKLGLLVFLCVIASISLFGCNQRLKRNVLNWYMFFISYHLIWIGIGFLNNNNVKGLTDTFRLYVIYPLVFLLFTITLSNSKKMDIIFKTIIFSNFLIALNVILLFTNAINLTNFDILYRIAASAGGAVHEGYTKIGTDSVNSLFFTFPFVVSYYRINKSKSKKFIMRINIVATIFAVLISGRRMLQIILIFEIILNYILLFPKESIKIRMKLLAGLFCMFLIGGFVIYLDSSGVDKYFHMDTFYLRMNQAFEVNSDNPRYIQIIELFKAFLDKPIFGVGFGRGITSFVRSLEAPWSYEVTYVLILYQTGVVGILMYIFLLYYNVHLILKIRKKYQGDFYIIPLINGYICFLIACFSNPLFGNFDFMWVIYIIPLYYNYLEINNNDLHKPLSE